MDSYNFEYEIPDRYIPEIGETIDKYKVLSKLGEGSFGNVYKAKHISTQKDYALKMLKLWAIPYKEERINMFKRFRMEFETGKIKSKYLVESKEYGKERGNPYIIMEFCPNGDLRAKVNTHLSVDFINQKSYEILLGLKSLHENGKIHRDMKPDNVLLDATNRAKLTDFGIAGHKNMRLTKKNIFGVPKEIFGTYAYMPPEQLKPREATKLPTTDIFSFGVIVYELFTSRLPFGQLENEEDLAEYILRANTGRWDNIKSLRNDIPNKWVQIIEKCIRPDYKERFQTIDEILKKLGKQVVQNNPIYNSVRNQLGLQVMQGEEYGKIYNLSVLIKSDDDGKLTIGRNDNEDGIYNNIDLSESPSDGIQYFISRQHATIEKLQQPKGWYIRDGQWINERRTWKQSLNGTYVNSEKVDKRGAKIKTGDIITIGDTTLKVIVI